MNIPSEIDTRLNDTVCRVCLSSDEGNECIFTSRMTLGNRSSADLWKKLEFYGGIEVKQGDGLPTKMCEKCVLNMRVAHDFRTLCQESDRKLRRLCRKVVNDGDLPEGNRSLGASDESTTSEAANERTSSESVLNPAGNMREEGPSQGNETAWEKKHNARKCERSALNKEELAEDASKRLNFRRVTSMENLKNCKELQRRYVKKTRKNGRDCEIVRTTTRRNVAGRKTREREIVVSHYTCSADSPIADRISCDRREEEFDRAAEFSEHAKSQEFKVTSKPAPCRICNKNFRKVLTMVRHLNVHKSENPRAVYAILRDIREKRRRSETIFENENASGDVSQRKKHSNLRLESLSRLDKSSVEDFSDPRKDANSNGTNETQFSDSSRTCEVQDESVFPSDVRTAIKLINDWIREELETENEGKGFICNICERSYVTKSSLLKHKTKVHDGSPGSVTCSRYSTVPEEIRESRRKLEETRGYRCKDCEKTFASETKLAKHKKIHIPEDEHEDKNFKRFLCHICSKTFRHNTGLMFHMRTHTGYKPHVCKYCGRGFTSNSNCTNHERTHTGDRPFVCHFCSAAFAKSCTLKAHITTHTGEAKYQCQTCGKSFRRLKYLKEHCFTHTGEKPYACKICGTAYSHSGSLFVHEKKCKAQHNNCQVTIGSYNDGRTLDDTPNLAIDPAMLSIQNPEHVTLNVIEDTRFVDQPQIMVRTNDNVHSILPNSPSTVRDLIALGHIFQA